MCLAILVVHLATPLGPYLPGQRQIAPAEHRVFHALGMEGSESKSLGRRPGVQTMSRNHVAELIATLAANWYTLDRIL